jgi:hypothetical protein
LRIVLLEVSEKGRIGEVLEARGVIRHDVAISWEEVCEVTVSVNPLMVAPVAAEGGGSSTGGDGSLADSRDCRDIVREVLDSGVPSVVSGRHEVHLGQESRVLKVTVGDDAAGVITRDEELLDWCREGGPPDKGVTLGVKVDSSHAGLGGISGTQKGRCLRDDLS